MEKSPQVKINNNSNKIFLKRKHLASGPQNSSIEKDNEYCAPHLKWNMSSLPGARTGALSVDSW